MLVNGAIAAFFYGLFESTSSTALAVTIGVVMFGVLFSLWPRADRNIVNPGIKLVPKFSRVRPSKKTGPTLRARAWLREHPGANYLLGFASAILANLVSGLLTGGD